MNTYNQIIELFRIDGSRKEFSNVYAIGDNAVATDGVGLIVIPLSKYNGPTVDNDPFIEKVKAVIPDKNVSINFHISLLSDLLATFPQHEETEPIGEDKLCKDCDGNGQVEWQYKSYTLEDACPVCNGEGCIEAPRKPTGRVIPKGIVKISNHFFDAELCYSDIVQIVKLLDAESVTISAEHKEAIIGKGTRFDIQDVSVILMPLNRNYSKEDAKILLVKEGDEKTLSLPKQ